jgi:copper(I)-binding protein
VNSVDFRQTVVNRVGALACGLVLANGLAGCSAGQISQTATQQPAVNGTLATFGDIALRNVHIEAVETGDALEPGQEVELAFLAINGSPDTDDQLLGITSDVGKVSITGNKELPAGGTLVIGAPDGTTALSDIESADAGDATVSLTKPIRNGLTYNFTFKFEQAGEHTVAVPISAGNAPRQG